MAGFREQAHTADWELEAWADDLPGLFEQVARGMYSLSGAHLQDGWRRLFTFQLSAPDAESLLVRFLSELLYITHQQSLGFDDYDLSLQQSGAEEPLVLVVTVQSAPLLSVDKEIKAVTYHNLAVRRHADGLHVSVVFDV